MDKYNSNHRNSTANSINGSGSDHREKFIERLVTVFCQGSGIPLGIVQQALEFVSDTHVGHGGDVSYPIHEALDWTLTRFGHRARPNQYAALIRNWDGTIWQAVLDIPERDGDQIKRPYTYRAPTRCGDRAYLTPILDWKAIIRDTSKPIIITEGAKKALTLIQLGDYAPIALYGCSCGTQGGKKLIPDLAQFRWNGRQVIIALDRDTKPSARRAVLKGTHRLARLLAARGAVVSIAQWDAVEGKGIDDLLVNRGIDRVRTVLANATDYQLWKLGAYRLTSNPHVDTSINTQWLPSLTDLTTAAYFFIRSYLGSGKTERLKEWIKKKTEENEDVSFICLYHRVSLAASSAEKFGFDLITGQRKTEDERQIEDERVRVCLCVDSLLFVTPPDRDFYLVIDEVSKVSGHLLGQTCNDKYAQLARHLQYLARHPNCRGIVGLDADLDSDTVQLWNDTVGVPFVVINNEYLPRRDITLWNRQSALLKALWGWIAQGERVFIPCATKADANTVYNRLVALGIDTLLLTADNSGEEHSIEFKRDPNRFLRGHYYQAVVASPTISEGVSIVGDHFDRVVGIFPAKSIGADSVCQFIRRYRPVTPIDIWVSEGDGLPALPEKIEHWVDQQRQWVERKHSRSIALLPPAWQRYAVTVEARKRAERASLRAAVYAKLLEQGYDVTFDNSPHCPETWREWQELKKGIRTERETEVTDSPLATLAEYQELEKKIKRGIATKEERIRVERFRLWERYALTTLSPEMVRADNGGRLWTALRKTVAGESPEWAFKKDGEKLDRLARNGGALLTDLPKLELTGILLRHLGILDLLREFAKDKNYRYSHETPLVVEIAEKAKQMAFDIRELLGVTITQNAKPTEIVGRLLGAIGMKTRMVAREHRVRYYSLDPEHMAIVVQMLKGMLSKEEYRDATSPVLSSLIETWWDDRYVPKPKPLPNQVGTRYKSPPYRQRELNL